MNQSTLSQTSPKDAHLELVQNAVTAVQARFPHLNYAECLDIVLRMPAVR